MEVFSSERSIHSLPPLILEKIFLHLVRKNKSFWPIISDLSQVCHYWSNVATYPGLRKCLTLDEQKILKIKRSHDENDIHIIHNILHSGTFQHLETLSLVGFQKYANKILTMLMSNIGKCFLNRIYF